MNEPILKKCPPHGLDYKPMTWKVFLQLEEAAQKVANATKYPVYLVGSATYKDLPRDIDISIIMPLEDYETMFGTLPEKQEGYSKYLYEVFHKSWTWVCHLHFCIDYHLDIKVCPDSWWTEAPKVLLAEPKVNKT
jgi:predicted nucleotidyltransferase